MCGRDDILGTVILTDVAFGVSHMSRCPSRWGFYCVSPMESDTRHNSSFVAQANYGQVLKKL